MLRRVHMVPIGDTRFITGEQVERAEVLEENDAMIAAGKQPAAYDIVAGYYQGLRCHYWFTFISGVVPGNDARVDRSGNHGQKDDLRGLKENVIVD